MMAAPLHCGEGPRVAGHGIEAVPYRNAKIVHFIRHGMGFHNEVQDYADYSKWSLFDAHLNQKGWAQARALNKHIRQHNLQVDIVVVSPLMRTMETAVGCFGVECTTSAGAAAAGDAANNQHTNGTSNGGASSAPPLMVPQDTEPGVRTAFPGATALNCPPFVAQELCRETLGVHPCDKRRSISHYKKCFPGIDFGLVENDEDVYWHETIRETDEELQARARKFAKWLMSLPQKNIAVVSHSGFIYHCMQNFGHGLEPGLAQHLHRHFNNCEMRSIVLYNPQHDESVVDTLWFVGGDTVQA